MWACLGIAVQSVKMVKANMLLTVFFVSGALAACPEKPALFITAPKQMEALSGSCLQIPCVFSSDQEFIGATTTSGLWFKSYLGNNPANLMFNSIRVDNVYPMTLTGDLNRKNCTTLFSSLITNYTGTYYFRIEKRRKKNNVHIIGKRPFEATAVCDPLQITVKDSPPRPRIEISGDLKEKQSVTITCSAFTPCPRSPPKLTWNLQQDPHSTIEENTDRTFTTKIQTNITLSDTYDGFNISCSANYPVDDGNNFKTAEERKTLSFLYSPRDTSVIISPADPVSVGSVVNLTCSCRGNPPVVNFVWFRISDDRLELIKDDSQVYGFKVTHGDRGRLYFCGCRNDLDIELSTGRQLMFEGDQQSGPVGAEVIVKILGIIMLISALVIFECWFRSKHSTEPVKGAAEAVYDNITVELQPPGARKRGGRSSALH